MQQQLIVDKTLVLCKEKYITQVITKCFVKKTIKFFIQAI